MAACSDPAVIDRLADQQRKRQEENLGPALAAAGGAGIIGFLTKIAAGKLGEKVKKYAEDKGILDSIPGIGGGGGSGTGGGKAEYK